MFKANYCEAPSKCQTGKTGISQVASNSLLKLNIPSAVGFLTGPSTVLEDGQCSRCDLSRLTRSLVNSAKIDLWLFGPVVCLRFPPFCACLAFENGCYVSRNRTEWRSMLRKYYVIGLSEQSRSPCRVTVLYQWIHLTSRTIQTTWLNMLLISNANETQVSSFDRNLPGMAKVGIRKRRRMSTLTKHTTDTLLFRGSRYWLKLSQINQSIHTLKKKKVI